MSQDSQSSMYWLQWVLVAVGTGCSGYWLQWVLVAVGTGCSGYWLQWVLVAVGTRENVSSSGRIHCFHTSLHLHTSTFWDYVCSGPSSCVCRAISLKGPNVRAQFVKVHVLFEKAHVLFVKVHTLFVKAHVLFLKVHTLFVKVHALFVKVHVQL